MALESMRLELNDSESLPGVPGCRRHLNAILVTNVVCEVPPDRRFFSSKS